MVLERKEQGNMGVLRRVYSRLILLQLLQGNWRSLVETSRKCIFLITPVFPFSSFSNLPKMFQCSWCSQVSSCFRTEASGGCDSATWPSCIHPVHVHQTHGPYQWRWKGSLHAEQYCERRQKSHQEATWRLGLNSFVVVQCPEAAAQPQAVFRRQSFPSREHCQAERSLSKTLTSLSTDKCYQTLLCGSTM